MKYTNEILNGDVNIQGLISNKKYLKPATVILTLPVAILGFVLFVLAFLPAAGMDLGRYVKLEYFRQVKIYHRVNYITKAVASLTSDKDAAQKVYKQLIEMI